MNRIFSIVWNRAIGQLVVASEFASSARGGASRQARRVTPLRAALYAGLVLAGMTSFSAYADTTSPAIANVSFETGNLSGWTTGLVGTQTGTAYSAEGTGASVVTGMASFKAMDQGGPTNTHSWTVTPYGNYMASLQANGDQDDVSQSFGTGAGALLLSAANQSAITTTMGGTPTNASWIYQDLTLNAGDTFTMAWQYVSTDYTPFNDVSVTSLVNLGDSNVLAMVNNELSQYALLGATNPGTGNYSTDSYGATGWQIATYSVSTAGVYRLGFMSVNLNDAINSPVLFVDQAPGATYDNNVPFGPIAPNEGSNAPTTPTTPSGPTTIDQNTSTADLGSDGGKFDGGTLTPDSSGNVDSNLTVTDKGGVIDQAGKDSNFTGTISDDSAGVPGNITIVNSDTGGSVTFSGDNTYTGSTSIGTGSTLSVAGDGTIASSSGVTNNGTFDIADANNNVDVKAINGAGDINLGGNDLVITNATGPGATGTISGTGGVEVTGGTQVLGGNNTYTGGTTVKDATVQIGSDENLGAASGGLALDNGTLHTTGDVDTARDVTVTGTGTFNTNAGTALTSTGTVSGDGTLVKNGAGTADFEGTLSHTGGTVVNAGTLVLGGDNTYTGGTTVNTGGTLQIDNDHNLGDASGDLTVNGGTLHTTGDVDSARDVTLTGNSTFDTDTNTSLTSTGDVSGTGMLVKQGGGTAEFDGTLSQAGGVFVSDGTLVLGGDNTFTGGASVVGGGTLQIDNDHNLGDASNFVVLSDGTLHTTGDVDTSRDVVLAGNGTLDVDAGTTLTSTGGVNGSGALVKDGEGKADFEGTLSHTGGTVVNDGTLVLGGNNTYTGGTTVNTGGTLQIDSDHNLGDASGNVTLNDGTLHTTGDVDTARDLTLTGNGTLSTDRGTTLTSTGDVSGDGALVKDGEGTADFKGTLSHTGGTVVNDGTLVLGGNNTYTGGTSVNAGGTLQIDNDHNLGDASGNVALNDGILHTTGDVDTARELTLTGNGTLNTGADTTLTSTGDVAGTGALVKNGEGTADFEGTLSHTGGTVVNDGTLVLGGNNTYTGGTTVNTGGTLQIDNDHNLGDASGNVALNDGTLHTMGDVDTARELTLTGNGTLNTDAGTTLASTGNVAGNGALVKDGEGTADFEGTLSHTGGTVVNDGTLVLAGNNTYTGGTAVNGGTLQIENDHNLGDASGNVTLNDGTLHTTGDVDTARDLTLTGNGTLSTDGGTTLTSTGDVSGNGTLVKNGEGTADFEGTLSHTGGTIVNDGTLVLGGNNTFTGGTAINGGTLQISNDHNLGDASGNISIANAVLHTTGNVDTARDILLGGFGVISTDADTTTRSTGTVSGAGTLVKDGAGTADFEGTLSHTGGTFVTEGTLVLGGNNTYTGGTVAANGGTLQIANDHNLGDAANELVLADGSLHTTGNVDTARELLVLGIGTVTTDGGTTTTSTGDVSGNGTLVKDGAGTADFEGTLSHTGGTIVNDGTLVLGGNNTYTGGTVINGGTLQIGSDQNLGDASGNLAIGNGVLHTTGNVDTARNIALAGVSVISTDTHTTTTSTGAISGTGTLVKDGEGTADLEGVLSHTGGTLVNDGILVLGGANTYTGNTAVNAGGTLQISRDSNLGDAANSLALNGGTLHTTADVATARTLTLNGGGVFDTAVGTTLASTGTLSGTGPLIKNGAGTADFEGTLSHAGGTVVNEGLLILGGNNSYTGGTLVNGSTLRIASDANLGNVAGGVTLNGGTLSTTANVTTERTLTLTSAGGSIDTASGTTLAQKGVITGTGTLTKLGGGTLVVSGANDFTGGTFIDGGVIRIDNGSSLGSGNIILRGGTLQTYATLGTGQQVLVGGQSGVNVLTGTSTVLSGDIVTDATAGCFVKSGGGSLSLTGHAMLGNGTCVQDGTLRTNGVLDSSFVSVDQGATLRGIGLVNGPVNVSGRLAPGNSPGTLTVNGTVTMSEGSTFEADIDGTATGTGRGSYSRLLVVGAGHQFIANGTLEPLLRGITGDASNTYTPALGDNYRVVTAEGGIVGRFDSLTQPASGLAANTRFLALYDVNGSRSIDLRVVPTAYGDLLGAGARGNAVSVAGALDRAVDAQVAGTADGLSGVVGAIGTLTAAQIPSAVKAMAGEVHADQAASARGMGLSLSRDAVDHLGTDSIGVANHVWANVTQDGQRSVADNQGSGFNTSTGHITAGVDVYATEDTVLGVGASHGESNVIASGGQGTIRSNAGLAYAQQKLGRVLVDGVVAYGSDDWSTRRADPLGAGSIESRTDGHNTTASLTARLPIDTQGTRIEPYATVVWQKVERDAVQEGGTSAAVLSLDQLSQTGTRGLLGVTAGSHANDPLASELTWRVGVAAGVDSGKLLDPTVHAHLAGQSFDTRAPDAGRGFVQVNASGTMRLSHSTYLYGGLNAEQGSGRSAYGVTAGVRVAF
ncbi:autotransporter-associated beta strand repeat-containing protein [Luteibacter pinisoli]|uniref:autotransporter-associated beta strand repeat-containing protein n=1 Tax=Luteibacter pinisoli TaxID=2589080 RepID=UPI001477817B|nr:autotransporter-associated beta strand repeat-containing protein [Luteibacter pinisoli]